MLKLQIKEYCHECDFFDPELKDCFTYLDGKKLYMGDRLVVCANKHSCDKIEKYLRVSNKPPNRP